MSKKYDFTKQLQLRKLCIASCSNPRQLAAFEKLESDILNSKTRMLPSELKAKIALALKQV